MDWAWWGAVKVREVQEPVLEQIIGTVEELRHQAREASGKSDVGAGAPSPLHLPAVQAQQVGRARVFVCHVPLLGERAESFLRVVGYWGPGVRVLSPPPGIKPREFQRYRRIVADVQGGEYYILTDDDCLPVGDVVERGLGILGRHPEYAILSLLPENETIVEWTPEDYQTASDAEVVEHVSVGGVRFCRKMPFTAWPAMPSGEYCGYDAVQCEAIRKAGKRVGYFRDLRMVHLGAGKSTLV